MAEAESFSKKCNYFASPEQAICSSDLKVEFDGIITS